MSWWSFDEERVVWTIGFFQYFVIGCNSESSRSVNYMLSDQLKQLTYHELAPTIHWRKVTDLYWIDEINYTIENNGYGDGTADGAGRAAIVEAWAYFLGPTVANVAYGIQCSPVLYQDQAFLYTSTATESSFLRAMERFNPNLLGDEIRWIPKGIMHDLMDNTNVNELFPNPSDDQVAGYTITQIFGALNNDVVDPIQYRNRLLQQNANNQQPQVNTLFTRYGYS
ncbi:MAG: hypothetical protein ABIV51_03825 [Saprospiraceae bacterium]